MSWQVGSGLAVSQPKFEEFVVQGSQNVNTLATAPNLPHVLIATPHHGDCSFEFATTMMAGLLIGQPDFKKSFTFMRGVQNLDVERNMMVKALLAEKGATHLLFIDSDMLPEEPVKDVNYFIRSLLATNHCIASAFYRAKQREGFPNAMWVKAIDAGTKEEGFVPIMEWSGNWIPADAIGMGFCLIERKVFEKMPYPWFKWGEDGKPSEDFHFCIEAKRYGFEARVLTDLKLSHEARVKIMPDGKIRMNDA